MLHSRVVSPGNGTFDAFEFIMIFHNHHKARRRLRVTGFTLVEAVVSVAVIGVGVASTLGALTKFNSIAATSRNSTGAAAALMTQVDLFQSMSPFNPQKTNDNLDPCGTVLTPQIPKDYCNNPPTYDMTAGAVGVPVTHTIAYRDPTTGVVSTQTDPWPVYREPARWTYPDTAARTSAVGFVGSDVGQLAYQSDTQTHWRLLTTAPTWAQDTSGGIIVKGTMTCTVTNISTAAMPNTYQAIFTIGYQYMGKGPTWNAARNRWEYQVLDDSYPLFRYMRIQRRISSGLSLVELSITMGVIGVVGLLIYTLLNIGTILGAKNTATNTAHQQARVAMIEMIQNLHSAVSLPALTGLVGNQASGISFQQWGAVMSNGVMTSNGGPHEIRNDANAGQNQVRLVIAAGQPLPIAGQRLIVPTHQIEDDIVSVSGNANDCRVNLANDLSVSIKGAGTNSSVGEIIAYITDRCSYNVVVANPGPPAQYKLQWSKVASPPAQDIVNDITNPRPFSIPSTPAGALYYRFVAAIDLSTSDPSYSNRGYKAANILLNGQVPFKTRLTTYQ